MKLNRFQIALIVIIAFIIFRNSVFFDIELRGTYISNAEEPILEIPRLDCTLHIHGNGKYTSDCMGDGTYEIESGCIRFSNGHQGWRLPILRRFNVGSPMLLLSGDMQYYMIKQ